MEYARSVAVLLSRGSLSSQNRQLMASPRDLAQNKRPLGNDGPIRIVDMNEADATSLFEALGDETTLKIYTAIQQDPKTPPELRELTDTSLQNTHYHLNKLEDAELVEPVDTWVSERGKELNVYGPTNSPLILSFAAEEKTPGIRSKIKNALGILGVISFFSLVAEYVVPFFVEPSSSWQQVGAGGYGEQESLTGIFLQYPGLCMFAVGLLMVLAYVGFISLASIREFRS